MRTGSAMCTLIAERTNRPALDYICDSLSSVAFGIGEWLHDGWLRSYPAGHRRHCVSGPAYSGTKSAVAI